MPQGMFVEVSTELRKKQHINKKAEKSKNKQKQNLIQREPNCIGFEGAFFSAVYINSPLVLNANYGIHYFVVYYLWGGAILLSFIMTSVIMVYYGLLYLVIMATGVTIWGELK